MHKQKKLVVILIKIVTNIDTWKLPGCITEAKINVAS